MKNHTLSLAILLFALAYNTVVFAQPELPVFFDRAMEQMMTEDNLPNAVIAVVEDGEVIFINGYSARKEEIQANARETLFRVGSVSKIFTWTAVMQLAEKGAVDLDADIQQYLDFDLPKTIKGLKTEVSPITLRHLLTHTSGFEDVLEGLFTFSPQPPLREYLTSHIPIRIYPAGQVMAYSNYNPALAGYIIERVSGMPFEEYIKRYIYAPLQMTSSSFEQPLPAELNERLVKAYRQVNGEFLPARFEHMPAPAGGLSTTAADMAKFMHFLLDSPDGADNPILNPQSKSQMLSPAFSYHPLLGGMTHGYMEFVLNGQQVIFHGGSTNIFDAGFYLLPETNTGIFIAYSGGNYDGHIKILYDYLQNYPPENEDNTSGRLMIAAAVKPSLNQLKGEYHQSRRIESTPDKSINLMMGVMRIDITDDEMLEVKILGQTLLFREVQPGIYKNTTLRPFYPFGPMQYLIAEEDHQGRLMLASDGPMTYIKMPWYATTAFAALLFVPMLALALGTIIFYVVRAFFRRLSRKHEVPSDRSFTARTLMVLHSFLFVFMLWLMAFTLNPDPVYQLPLSAFGEVGFSNTLLSIMPWLIAATTLAMVYFSIQTWKDKLRKKPARIFYQVYTLVSLGLFWLFWYYNLVG
ncbi:MAG: serine hydrolase domain-containing protein [bacterium]